jgi:hypothetical protein
LLVYLLDKTVLKDTQDLFVEFVMMDMENFLTAVELVWATLLQA